MGTKLGDGGGLKEVGTGEDGESGSGRGRGRCVGEAGRVGEADGAGADGASGMRAVRRGSGRRRCAESVSFCHNLYVGAGRDCTWEA